MMGCDIHCYAEKMANGKYVYIPVNVFDYRSYGLFGFLAGVRNYSAVTPICAPRGVPSDVSAHTKEEELRWDSDGHSASWLSTKELLDFNYDAEMEDRRVMINNNGGCTCPAGEGAKMTYREFLGPGYFDELEKLKSNEADRIVFWFDN